MVMRVLIMAGGTGGHVFPALAVAEELRGRGAEVLWLGTRAGLEADVVPRAGVELAQVSVSGLRGKSLARWLLAPLRLALALAQSLAIILRFRPAAVLGMGGFAAGPGGVAAWLLHKPLLIHEQNAVAGLTNRWLARVATTTMVAFPGVLPPHRRSVLTGNPVRAEIAALAPPEERYAGRRGALCLLVLGGSQGAQALNEAVVAAAKRFAEARRPRLWHQAGARHVERLRAQYLDAGVEARAVPFIDDMAQAYGWADLVVCRAGALTVAELSAAGVASILVPYPHAVDDHQTHNAAALVEAGAAVLLRQGADLAERLVDALERFYGAAGVPEEEPARARLLEMARAARRLAQPQAAARVAELCLEAARA